MGWSFALCRSLRTRRAQVLRHALRRTGAELSAMDRYKAKHGKRGLPSQASWFHGIEGNGLLQAAPPGPRRVSNLGRPRAVRRSPLLGPATTNTLSDNLILLGQFRRLIAANPTLWPRNHPKLR